MAPVAATRSGRGSSSVFRGVLSGVMLVTAVIIGLLAMHTLNLHGTAAADAPATMSMSGAVDQPAAHHATAEMHAPAGSTSGSDMSCAGCTTDDHAGMAMMCVLALLLALLLLVPPRVLHGWTRSLLRPSLVEDLTAQIRPRAPSLHVLCISRT